MLLTIAAGGSRASSLKPDDLPVPPRQTLFFSATWPKEVQSIARQLCRNDPVRVFVGDVQVGTGVTGFVCCAADHGARIELCFLLPVCDAVPLEEGHGIVHFVDLLHFESVKTFVCMLLSCRRSWWPIRTSDSW